MDCDWIFASQDRSRQEVTLEESAIPRLGNGKVYAGKGFEVILVVEKRVMQPNLLALAFEFVQKS
jgi:hypothetical protein